MQGLLSKVNKKQWFALSVSTIAAAALMYGFVDVDVAEASLRSKVTSSNSKELETVIDNAGSSIIDTIRQVAIIFCVLLVASMGYSVWIKKTAEGLADVKGRLIGLVLGLVCVFFSESIIGTVLGWFGYKG